MKKINVAVVGCGRIAGHHCRAIKLNQNYNLIAVCDLIKEKSDEYAKEFECESFDNYDSMLSVKSEIDLVSIVTPSGMHHEHACDIINKYKKSVVVEKPTFMKPSQIREAYILAKKNNVEIFPVFQNRYNIAVQKVKQSIDTGELGEVRLVSVRVRWCRPQRYYEMSDWRGTFSHDGGALTNQGIHHVDLIRYLGGEVEQVNCTMGTIGVQNVEVEDTAVGTFKFSNGRLGTLEVTTAARPDDFEASISIVGSKGLAQIGGIAVNMLEIFTPDTDVIKQYSDDFSDLPDRGKVYGRGHMSMYSDISRHMIENISYPITQYECLETIKLLHAFYLSDENKNWIKINNETESNRLGRSNDEISNLYRNKF
jgi:UDP-N-acetyl-2-amino-2-deoxyglucuronate dehydrogenase